MTSFATVVVAICQILLIRVIAKGLGPEELGVYTLVRRTVAVLLPFTSLSIGIGLTRYIALYRGEEKNIASILPAAVILSSIWCLMVVASLFPFSALLSKLVFDNEGREIFFKLILFLLVGENFYVSLYGYYRGRQMMMHANISNMLLMGILPVTTVILLINAHNLSYVIYGIGTFFFISLFILLPIIVNGIRMTNWNEFIVIKKKLLAYSIPRIPGGVALTLIFTFGVLASPYFGGIVNAAYMSIGIWIFSFLSEATGAFGMVILPKAAKFIGSGREDDLKSKLRPICDFIFCIGLFMFMQLLITLDFIIFIWLGPEYSEAVIIARIMICAMIPYFFYTMMRSIIDAVEIRAINTYNVYISLLITIISSFLLIKAGVGFSALAIGFDAGLISLGLLTCFYIKRRYHIKLLCNNFSLVLFMNILFCLLVYLVKYEKMSNQFSYQNFALIVLLEMILGIVYIVALKKTGSPWISEVLCRISRPVA